jgi:formylglycine-generating enzyme required for sulfatase activity
LRPSVTRALLALLLAVVSRLSLSAEGPRYALVIGNGGYADFGKLANPVNDATDIAAALKSLGFQVVLLTDASRKQMNGALNDFHDRLAQDSSSAGFFWFAGHGIQSKGENFLLPVGAQIRREVDLDDEAVNARRITALLDDARNRVNVVVLDACRSNPIPSMGRTGARGLMVVSQAPAESVIMYSTGAGQVAADGNGRNSPFAQAFLKHMAEGGDITATIKAVTAETKRLTNGVQVPYLYSSLTLDFALNPRAPAPSAARAAAAAAAVTVTKGSGSLSVSAASAGELYLDGAKVADLGAGDEARIDGVAVGDRSIELRYADGEIESKSASVQKGRSAAVGFAYRPAAPKLVPAAGDLPPDFVLVPGGTFAMGSPASEGGRDGDETLHSVSLSSFAIGKYDVTLGEFREFVNATGYATSGEADGRGGSVWTGSAWERNADATWENSYYSQSDRNPVVQVSWYDAVAYCNWRSAREGRIPAYKVSGTKVSWDRSADGYRLPTEAEWEYAAKGGRMAAGLSASAVFAGSSDPAAVAWYDANSGGRVHQVGLKAPNALGLYDMAGNVYQWCWDWSGPYRTEDQRDPVGAPFGKYRVDRGGGFTGVPRYTRSACRGGDFPDNRRQNLGFRLALSRPGE